MRGAALVSVLIAAYEEEGVIGRTLDTLLLGANPGELDVVVVANGCSDGTATEAAQHGARVLETRHASKALALNLADEAAPGFPRLYLDADTPVNVDDVRALATALVGGGGSALAAAPARWVSTSGRPVPVRAYYAINNRLPIYQHTLFGRGAIMVSEEGRRRFGSFPNVVADDLFLDSQFSVNEKTVVGSVRGVIEAPHTTQELIRRLARVRRGNRELATADPSSEHHASSSTSWLRHVVLRRPYLAPAGLVYVAITVWAERIARGGPTGAPWRTRTDQGRSR